MRRGRDRSINGRARRKRTLRTVELLESRCVLSAGPPQTVLGAPPPVNESNGYSNGYRDSGAFVTGPRAGMGDPRLSGIATDYQNGYQNVGMPHLSRLPDSSPNSFGYSANSFNDASGIPKFEPTWAGGVDASPLPPPKTEGDFYGSRSGVFAYFEAPAEGRVFVNSGSEWSVTLVVTDSLFVSSPVSAHNAFASPPEYAPSSYATPPDAPPAMHPMGPYQDGGTVAMPPVIAELPAAAISNQSTVAAAQHQPMADAVSAAVAAPSVKFAPPATSSIQVAATAVHATQVSTTLSAGNLTDQSVPPWTHTSLPFGTHARNGSKLATGNDRSISVLAPTPANGSLANLANLRSAKLSLAEVPLDLRGVEQALQTVMSEMELLGAGLSHWLTDVHLAEMAAAVALGAGAAIYLRRRNVREAIQPDDEPSSSWIFERLQPLTSE
ncbi:MAG TPA: hypothetical protein VGY55_02170 [Pirellulales bacterium]|jgi:hypothetical protein|nr:hypothetical protein [Pirellulales bacterium]